MVGERVEPKDIRRVAWKDVVEAIEVCYELGWTDGLPVVPPSLECMETFLNDVQQPAHKSLGASPECRCQVPVGNAAADAVTAVCLPEYFLVVIIATEAILDPAFTLTAPSSSQDSAAIVVIVNGPIVRQLHINCRNNLFGPANRANATIGRAIRLIAMNVGTAKPSLFDRSIFGEQGWRKHAIQTYLYPRMQHLMADLNRRL